MMSVEAQQALAEEISKNLRNFRKDGAERKSSVEYFKRCWNKLEELWNEFQFNHDQISMQLSHNEPYFVENLYGRVKEDYEKFKKLINEEYQRLLESSSASGAEEKLVKPAETRTESQPSTSRIQDEVQHSSEGSRKNKGSFSHLDELLRKQEANFRAFARTVANIQLEGMSEKWEFEDSLKRLENRWSVIDSLHWEIDLELNGKDLSYESQYAKYEQQFQKLQKEINKKMWSDKHREKSTPLLDIPVFTGNYNDWISFKDLFLEVIHNNTSLSNAQKLQFLKSKIKGEAERLIKHLAISSENYLTCWEILSHRFDNKRFIFTSHMNILFNLPNIQHNSTIQIKRMHDITKETINSLKNLGLDVSSWDPILVHILCQKLDSETYSRYIDSVKNTRELPILQELLDFLESKFTTLETSFHRKTENFPTQKTYNNKKPTLNFTQKGNNNCVKTFHVSTYKCPLCKNDHGIYNCKTFLQMPNDKKLSTVNKLGICINCLFSHNGKSCNSTKTCRKCPAHHNTIMHDALEKSPYRKPLPSAPAPEKNQGENIMSMTSHLAREDCSEILLATAQLKVLGANGKYYILRALVDQGSQISIITEHAAQLLGIKREKCKGIIYGVGQQENNCKGKINITCTSLYNEYTFNSEVIIMNNLVKSLPNKTFPKPSWQIIQNINLADPEFYISRPVDLLLGAEIYSNIILNGIIKSDDTTQPTAQQTQLGWLLCGSAQTFYCNAILSNIEDIQRFWEVEDIQEEQDLSEEEVQCIQYYQDTTLRRENGRYEVRIPMKSDFPDKLGLSKTKALAQFRNQENKLSRQPDLAQAYKIFMEEYEQLRHMEPVNSNKTPECYLPHHGVERAESTTTKYRVVFNASSKTSTGFSLNDLMYAGPNLQQDLLSLLIRWRQYKYVFTADIEKMYRQILVNRADTSLQKIVWRASQQQPIQAFELTTVTYGTKAAPFLAMMTLKRLASDERNNFPEAAKVVEQSFYMDDLVHGTHDISEGKKLIQNLITLLRSGGFSLRKWTSNNTQLLENISKELKNNIDFKFKSENTPKTLGLCWSPETDTFTFKYEMKSNQKITKRILLSQISIIFDPLGWLAPLVIKMKMLFQKVWKSNIKWDEEVSCEILKEWKKIQEELPYITSFKIPRWLRNNKSDVIELHGFCDASMDAYACVIYARVKPQNQITIVAAKTKVVPLKKKLTLPKLELSGAHLLSKLILKIKLTLNNCYINVFGWTDSKVVLGWLQGDACKWKPFVANRVKQITKIMPAEQWRYVSTNDNPADPASRGLYASKLLKHDLWWNGPQFLSTFEPTLMETSYVTEQEKKLSQTNIVQTKSMDQDVIDLLLTRYNNFYKILNILAWILRALTPKRKQSPSYITLHELRKAKLTIIKYVQNKSYDDEIQKLSEQMNLPTTSKLLNLHPFIDQDGILRVGGRLVNANLSMEMKHPKIIPNNTRLATLLISQAHELTFHGGPRLTLAMLRQEYWILGGNNSVKKELRQCITCRKQEGRKLTQLMGNLPRARCEPAPPFYHTGVDYTGCVDIKANKGRGARTVKGYIAIFVCMVTKAIHLELVSDLSSSAFIAALRRMVARRGLPKHLYSDNGTNFVGANRVIREEYQHLQHEFNDSFLREIVEMNIEWHFNAPSWPSAGGLWERAVRSLKHHLRRVIGEQKLTFEEYATLLSQVEGCLNSRPLCALSENVEDLDFLTPAHFLTGRSGLTVIETKEDARTRWHLTQKLTQDIWKRWKTEYLTQLTVRPKWNKEQNNIEKGSIVMIQEDHLPPGKWAMGRVIEVHPGSDGIVRVVSLKTKNGVLKRPIVKLSVLPLEKHAEEFDNSNIKHNANQATSRSLITTTLMFLCLFSIFISPIQAFNTIRLKDNQKIYFDKISEMQLIRDQWKIIAYYDLNPYWESTMTYNRYNKHLQNMCETLNQLSYCKVIMLQLQYLYDELNRNNEILLSNHFKARATKRRRRGLVNGIGYLANSLFGILDDQFAQQYKNDIDLVRENEKHLALLWKNQTSVLETEFNILKQTKEYITKQNNVIVRHLSILDNKTNQVVKQLTTNEEKTDFTMLAMAANNILTHLKNVQDALLETITNIYKGTMNIHILDPKSLQHELSVISGYLSKELTLPINNVHTEMASLYHLLSIKARVTKQYLIFEVKIPLISRDSYNLYNVVPIPYQINNKMIKITPIEEYVAINLHKDSYLPVTRSDLEHCLYREPLIYLCQLKTPIYKMKTDNDLCLKTDNQAEQCSVKISPCQSEWISLHKLNQYLYFCCGECQLRSLCEEHVTTYQLNAAHIVNINNNCEVKTENFTVYTHNRLQNEMEIKDSFETPYIAPINQLINITIETVTENWTNMSTESLVELEQRIKLLKQEEPLPNNLSVHDIHHYTVIYGIVAVVAVVAAVCGCRRVRRRWRAAAAPTREPEPAPDAAGPRPAARTSCTMSDVQVPVILSENSASVVYSVPNESVRVPRYIERGTTITPVVLRKQTFNEL